MVVRNEKRISFTGERACVCANGTDDQIRVRVCVRACEWARPRSLLGGVVGVFEVEVPAFTQVEQHHLRRRGGSTQAAQFAKLRADAAPRLRHHREAGSVGGSLSTPFGPLVHTFGPLVHTFGPSVHTFGPLVHTLVHTSVHSLVHWSIQRDIVHFPHTTTVIIYSRLVSRRRRRRRRLRAALTPSLVCFNPLTTQMSGPGPRARVHRRRDTVCKRRLELRAAALTSLRARTTRRPITSRHVIPFNVDVQSHPDT